MRHLLLERDDDADRLAALVTQELDQTLSDPSSRRLAAAFDAGLAPALYATCIVWTEPEPGLMAYGPYLSEEQALRDVPRLLREQYGVSLGNPGAFAVEVRELTR